MARNCMKMRQLYGRPLRDEFIAASLKLDSVFGSTAEDWTLRDEFIAASLKRSVALGAAIPM